MDREQIPYIFVLRRISRENCQAQAIQNQFDPLYRRWKMLIVMDAHAVSRGQCGRGSSHSLSIAALVPYFKEGCARLR